MIWDEPMESPDRGRASPHYVPDWYTPPAGGPATALPKLSGAALYWADRERALALLNATADPIGFPESEIHPSAGRPKPAHSPWLPLQVFVITSVGTVVILTLAWWAFNLWGPA